MIAPEVALLFDLDGVLIDSTAAVVRQWRLFADEHHLDESGVLARIHGRRTIDNVRELLAGREQSEIDEAASRSNGAETHSIRTAPHRDPVPSVGLLVVQRTKR